MEYFPSTLPHPTFIAFYIFNTKKYINSFYTTVASTNKSTPPPPPFLVQSIHFQEEHLGHVSLATPVQGFPSRKHFSKDYHSGEPFLFQAKFNNLKPYYSETPCYLRLSKASYLSYQPLYITLYPKHFIWGPLI